MIGALAVPQLVQPTSSSSSIALNLDLICSSQSTGKATLEAAARRQGKEAICKQPNRGYVRWSAPRHQLQNLTSCGWFMCKVRFVLIIHSASPISLRCGSLTWNALIDFNPVRSLGRSFSWAKRRRPALFSRIRNVSPPLKEVSALWHFQFRQSF
jgi:hypothetical protein